MNIILSIDYEIFGDGSGNVNSCMIKPLDKMLELASRYHASLVIFAETMEIQVLQDSEQYKTESEAICKQLQVAYANGHDVQLHLHPQMQGANIQANGQFGSLKAEKWRIGNLDKNETQQLIKQGKQWLEQLLQPIDKHYQCIAFRAGGWCIQPSEAIISSLLENGVLIDSTVAPGAKSADKSTWFDFRKSPLHKAYWKADSDILQPSSKGIYELPITTSNISWLKHLSIIINNMHNDSLAPDCHGSYNVPGEKNSRLLSKIRKLANLGHVMLDISTMPAETLIKITQNWQNKFAHESDLTAVAIGHTKNFSSRSAIEFEKYLQWAKKQNHQFISYQQWGNKHY